MKSFVLKNKIGDLPKLKKYTCIFPGLYNYILTKDVGMIPFTLSGKYDTKIITYDNDNFIYMDSILKKNNFSLEILEDSGNEKEDVKRYIKNMQKALIFSNYIT